MRKTGFVSKILLAGLAAVIALCPVPSSAQQPAAATPPAFDVVSIRKVEGTIRIETAPGMIMTHSNIRQCQYLPDRVSCQNTPLELIREAYQLDYIQLDSPKWMNDSDHVFAVQATMTPGTTKETARLMLRQMLAERLGLKVHWEKRDVPVYALLPGKHGVKLQPADANPKPKSIQALGGIVAHSGGGPGEYFSVGERLSVLAGNMRFRGGLDRPVVNMTGLEGIYQFDLHWTAETGSDGWVDPGFLKAVQDQLGLRLEKRTLPYDVLVVDHCERTPTAN